MFGGLLMGKAKCKRLPAAYYRRKLKECYFCHSEFLGYTSNLFCTPRCREEFLIMKYGGQKC